MGTGTMSNFIDRFLDERFVGTLAVVGEDGSPRVATIFYVCDGPNSLIFKSRSGSEHMQRLFEDPRAALGVYDHESNYKEKQGVQLLGSVSRISDPQIMESLVDAYGNRFAGARDKFAAIDELISPGAPSTLFRFEIKEAKVTSSAKGIADLEYSKLK
jgi:uncharacterized protein YhbP (UPF0306 family)